MVATASGTLLSLVERRKNLEEWDCQRMDIVVAASLTDDTLVEINFTDTIGLRKNVPKAEKRNDSNCLWLNPAWKENTIELRHNKIIPYFVGAASKAGFKVSGRWEKNYDKIVFTCIWGRRNDEHKNKEAAANRRSSKSLKKPNCKLSDRVHRSQRPPKLTQEQREDPYLQEEMDESDLITCKVSWSVFWDDTKIRWFIPKQQSGCKRHTGHPHIDHPFIRLQTRHALSSKEIQLAESAVESDITGRQTSAMIETRTGVNLDSRQVDYIRRRREHATFLMNGNSSSADKLSAYFSQRGVSSVSLYAEIDSGLLTIKQKSRASDSNETNVTNFDDDLGDSTETPEMFARSLEGSIRSNLTDTATGSLLLLAVWTTDTARRKFDMFPEFVGVDDTEGTNAEERPLHDWCGKDGNNEIYPFKWAFLPSKAQWSYTHFS